ncbi:MAG: glycosyl transferase family protein [Parcubacteria group bacterium Gr01-1014_44]|nr:MAG: glycosyl transferase family protein [Parcubacteria group bacterium Gr01-1014_44]
MKVAVATLLAVVFFIPFFSAQNFSPATDEITHLPSGYSYWKTSQIILNPQHPPLVKLMASFPLLFMDLKFDPQDSNLIGPARNEWAFGSNFLFSNEADRLLFWGRLPIMLLSVLLAFYLYKWTTEIFRPKAGLLSLFLYAFIPSMMANAQFVTTDLPLASFSFITFYYLWKFITTGLKRPLVYSGLFLGLALSSKFSAVIFLPLAALFIFIYAWRFRQDDLALKIRRWVNLTALMAFPALAVMYLSYLLPTDPGFYLKGLKTVYADWKPGYNFYLNGLFSPDGWWYYFLEAFLIKTPLPVLIALAASLLFYKKIKMDNWSKALVFLPILLFGLMTSLKAHQISIRYLIPIFPFLLLYVGGLAAIFNLKLDWRRSGDTFLSAVEKKYVHRSLQSKLILITAIILAGWLVFSSIRIYPDHLAYFNELVGGPKNGYKYLDDSNIEWGQDLKRLGKYQTSNPDTKVIYSWKNSNPEYYQVKNFMMADDSGWWREPKGRYAVNTFLLIRMQLLSQQRNDPALNWLALYEPVDKIGYSFFVYDFK